MRDTDDVLRALPEIRELNSGELKHKTAEVWAEAWTHSRWVRLEDAVMDPGLAEPLIGHTRAVFKAVLAAARAMTEQHAIQLDNDVLMSGVLLHDVGKVLLYQPDKIAGKVIRDSRAGLLGHAILGACLAYKAGLPLEIVHMIAAHSVEGNHMERSPECLLMHGVDFSAWDVVNAVRGQNGAAK